MTSWNDGYVSTIGYTYGYYPDLNPLRIGLPFINNGFEPPKIRHACELGFGQGVSINIHAAANAGIAWEGTDFNPTQSIFAKKLSADSGANIGIYDQSFSDFCSREDLPDFDYIGIHGIWSWVSDENRAILLDFLSRKLALGGVLYISYNTLPGWAAAAPLRHLLSQYSDCMTSDGSGVLNQIKSSLEFTEKLIETNPVYTKANSLIPDRFNKLKDQNPNYLAHEYFNRDWKPVYFMDMKDALESCKLTYVCSANYLDHIDTINLTAEQIKFLEEIPDKNFKQAVRDFMVNQQFRRDYWVKGEQKLDTVSQFELIRQHKVVLSTPRSNITTKANGCLGEVTLNNNVYDPILDILQSHKVFTIGEIEKLLQDKSIPLAQLLQSIMMLAGMGYVYSADDKATIEKSKSYCNAINKSIILKSRSSNTVEFLASPVTGGGVMVSRFHQLFLLALSSGKKLPNEWVDYVWSILFSQGQTLLKDGISLKTEQENKEYLTEQALVFEKTTLPSLKALLIA